MHIHRSAIEILEARIAPAIIFATANKNLISFDTSAPNTILSTVPITGLGANERIEGMDFRPATGELYLLGVNDLDGAGTGDEEGRIYVVNREFGFATALSDTPFSTTLAADARYGFDFNPVADRIRVVNTADQNLRVNPNNGALTQTDTVLDEAALTESIYAVAYDRNFDGTNTTTLYGIDYNGDNLVTIGSVDGAPNSPNGGVVTSIGALGFTANNERGGFDIDGATGAAFAAMFDVAGPFPNLTTLYSINLTTGAATAINPIGDGTTLISGFAIAPQFVNIVNPTTATFTDADGDLVTVKVSKGTLTEQNFKFASKAGGGLQLRLLDLAANWTDFDKTNLSITAKPQAGKGNGFTEVGYISAAGMDLGVVKISGDLGQIDAGNGDTSKKSPGIASLTVHSMGLFETTTQGPISVSLQSDITGPLGKLTVQTQLNHATIAVNGAGTDANGTIGAVTIGGNVVGALFLSTGGGITATGSIASITVKGSILGGTGSASGQISAGGTIGKVFVGGDLIGATGPLGLADNGSIASGGKMGSVFVGGDVIGGSKLRSGSIHSSGGIGNVTVKGSLIGGEVMDPVADTLSGSIYATGGAGSVNKLGKVIVGGSVQGGSGGFGGSIQGFDGIASISVTGSVMGGASAFSGTLVTFGKMGPVTIGGDLIGGTSFFSGSIYNGAATGSIGNILVKGSVIAGSGLFCGILSLGTLGAVKIGGDLRADFPTNPVIITATGAPDTKALAIKSVTVGLNVTNAQILVGFSLNSPSNPDAAIGAVTVGGNWTASSLVAGILSNNGIYGDADDTLVNDPNPSDGFASRIASITIKGMAIGTIGGTDGYGFVAQQIGKLKIGSATYPFITGPSNDLIPTLVGPTGDLRIREV